MPETPIIPGDTLLLDGKAYTITSADERVVRATHEMADGRTETARCGRADVLRLGPGLFGLAGRLEPHRINANAVQASAASIAITAEG